MGLERTFFGDFYQRTPLVTLVGTNALLGDQSRLCCCTYGCVDWSFYLGKRLGRVGNHLAFVGASAPIDVGVAVCRTICHGVCPAG